MILTIMSAPDPSPIFQIERPDPKLMTYYFVVCLFTGPLFPILILPNYFRYHTMRYRFDEEGIVEVRQRHLRIVDPEALQRLVNGSGGT